VYIFLLELEKTESKKFSFVIGEISELIPKVCARFVKSCDGISLPTF
jgi:hypothetical protein